MSDPRQRAAFDPRVAVDPRAPVDFDAARTAADEIEREIGRPLLGEREVSRGARVCAVDVDRIERDGTRTVIVRVVFLDPRALRGRVVIASMFRDGSTTYTIVSDNRLPAVLESLSRAADAFALVRLSRGEA